MIAMMEGGLSTGFKESNTNIVYKFLSKGALATVIHRFTTMYETNLLNLFNPYRG